MRIKRSLSAIIAAILFASVPLAASAQVSIGLAVGFGGPGWGVGFAAYSPPALPAYAMPPAPYPNWQWCPGYWGWGAYGYYWVPGYWTAPPAVGLYWTPGYWGYGNGGYYWNSGYWGPTVGFYGGIEITATATSASGTSEAIGRAAFSTTTPRSSTSTERSSGTPSLIGQSSVGAPSLVRA